jgi:maltoporin
MNKLKLITLSGISLAGLISAPVFAESSHDIGSHGYFRYNSGLSKGNDEQVVFMAPGAGGKYRYGNETDLHSEISIYDTYKLNGDDPDSAYFHMEAMFTVRSVDGGFSAMDFDNAEEFYIEAGNLTTKFGSPKIWGGRRMFLERYTTDMNDFAFLNTTFADGVRWADGAGIRDIAAGPGLLDIKLVRVGSDRDIITGEKTYQTNFDVRLDEIEVNPGGKLMLWGLFSSSSSKYDIENTSGFAVGVAHKQADTWGGNNRFMIQYGTGLAREAGHSSVDSSLGQVKSAGAADDLEDAKTFRITNQLVVEPNDSFGMETTLIYESRESQKFDGKDQVWLSAGIRPYYFISDYFRIPVEIGVDYVDDKTAGTSGTLVKATIAAEFALTRGVWSRPVIRAYVTHAQWSDSFVGQVGGVVFQDANDGLTAGVQVETWW